MFPITLKVTVNKPKVFKQKTWRKVLKQSAAETGRYFYNIFVNKKFTQAGAQEYRFQPRKKDYLAYKAKRGKGVVRPLFFSGRTEKDAKGVRDIRANSKGFAMVLHLPFYIKKKEFAKSPAMNAEMAKMSRQDIGIVSRFMDRRIEVNIRKEQKALSELN